MDEQQIGLPREEIAFQRMRGFHLQRVSAVTNGEVPLDKREGGILVLHLIPECCVLSRKSLDGAALKEHGRSIRPLGGLSGNTRFNVDGFLNFSGHDKTRAYSQMFRDGRLEAVMSGIGHRLNGQLDNSTYVIRCGVTERAVFDVVHDYLRFCRAVEFDTPVWLFSALVDCGGFRTMLDWTFRELSDSAVDRSPAVLPEIKIASFEADPQQLLRPWCDALWQSSGLERSLNYDQDGSWHEPR